MRLLLLFVVFLYLFCYVLSKNVKTLSESMGQEVIEIAGPKELPPGLEEEPSADMDDDDDLKSSTGSITKKDGKKTTSVVDARKKLKDVEKLDGLSPEDEEAKLEKELAEIYKDSDYKDSSEDSSEPKEIIAATEAARSANIDDTNKPIGRQRNNFKFAPDSTNKKDVDRFRTSVDDIKCKNKQKLVGMFMMTPSPNKDATPDESAHTSQPNSAPNSAPERLLTETIRHISLVLITTMWL